ncbi:MAG: S8 family serine peptidase [Alphaproteobacteria bacterium]|nr:S8 family serine peptidase [Alphaproteobacteria bacterium]
MATRSKDPKKADPTGAAVKAPAGSEAEIDPWFEISARGTSGTATGSTVPQQPAVTIPTMPSATAIDVLLERLPKKDPDPALKIEPIYTNGIFKNSRICTGTIQASSSTTLPTIRRSVARLKSSRPMRPQLQDGLRAANAPSAASVARPREFTGRGVVVGFIDNGCAFAHPNFRRAAGGNPSRVRAIWHQARSTQLSAQWRQPRAFSYGLEITGRDLDAALASPSPDKAYDKVGLRFFESSQGRSFDTFTHGTHVMDIAAGSGPVSGVAPDAEIVFVQLPGFALRGATAEATSRFLLDGVAYVFDMADRLAKERGAPAPLPAVVNISYGGFCGPHDGSSLVERGIDEMLDAPNRAVVFCAGNGHESHCHTSRIVEAGETETIRWIVPVDDCTPNFLEIWYVRNDDRNPLAVTIRDDNGTPLHKAAVLPEAREILVRNQATIGVVVHRRMDPGNGCSHVVIALDPTTKAPCVAGTQTSTLEISLHNQGVVAARVDAWIERDDKGDLSPGVQSRFDARDSTSSITLSSIATGRRTICVGAYNTATNALLSYSAGGPTRDGRKKPDLIAPGASDLKQPGILAAAARRAHPLRLGGTSMAAPFVTGTVALLFEAAARQGVKLHARDILNILTESAAPHAVDNPIDADRIGAGRLDIAAAIRALAIRLARPT